MSTSAPVAPAAPVAVQEPAPAAVQSPGGLCALAALPANAPLTAEDLGRLLGRNPQVIQRTATRGELPPPFRFQGRHCWTAGAILEHFGRMQADALALAGRRERRRVEARP